MSDVAVQAKQAVDLGRELERLAALIDKRAEAGESEQLAKAQWLYGCFLGKLRAVVEPDPHIIREGR